MDELRCQWCGGRVFVDLFQQTGSSKPMFRWTCRYDGGCHSAGPLRPTRDEAVASMAQVAPAGTLFLRVVKELASLSDQYDVAEANVKVSAAAAMNAIQGQKMAESALSVALRDLESMARANNDAIVELQRMCAEEHDRRMETVAVLEEERKAHAELMEALDAFSGALFEVYPDKYGKFDYLDQEPGRFEHYGDMVLAWYRGRKA